MIDTARWKTFCGKCKKLILPGDRISWEEGRMAEHEVCPPITALPDTSQVKKTNWDEVKPRNV